MDTKKCRECGVEKPLDEFFNYGKGIDAKCKVCRLSYNRERYKINIAPYTKKYTYEDVETKICRLCGHEKSVSEFNLHHAKVSGSSKYRSRCRECETQINKNNPRIQKNRKAYNIRNADKIKERKKRYLSNADNLEKARLYSREYQKKFPHKQRERLFKKYGITAQQYDELLLSQNGCCAICGTKKNGRKKNFVIDHCHNSQRVRGLLCTQCNAGLGNYKDSPDLLEKAKQYLTSI
jgi:rubredoxin